MTITPDKAEVTDGVCVSRRPSQMNNLAKSQLWASSAFSLCLLVVSTKKNLRTDGRLINQMPYFGVYIDLRACAYYFIIILLSFCLLLLSQLHIVYL
jgi:hypothetical protein